MRLLVLCGLLILAPQQQDKYPGAKGKEPIKIDGIELGMTSGQVINVLGLPESKTGELAGGDVQFGSWMGITVDFFRGRVTGITAFERFKDSNVPMPDESIARVRESMGEPSLLSRVGDHQYLKYKNGLDYAIKDGADPIQYVEYSKSSIEFFKRPGWGLEITESSGFSNFSKDSPHSISSATVQGIVVNSRPEPVKVIIRTKWYEKPADKSMRFLNAADKSIGELKPGEKKVFRVICGSFVKSDDKVKLVYDAEAEEEKS